MAGVACVGVAGDDERAQVRRAWATFGAVALSNLQMSMSLSMILSLIHI